MTKFLETVSREDWLKNRLYGIGGSDAGAVLGLNRYRTNVDVFNEKTGRAKKVNVSGKPAVQYGKKAEAHIRELFLLDHPEYNSEYHEFRMYYQEGCSHIYATLDGELYHKQTGKRGVLEIKTTTIQNSSQWKHWDGRIPDTYFAQVLHQMWCFSADFAIVKARIRYMHGDELRTTEREYYIERDDAQIKYLVDKETEFWECVKADKEPPLILPRI